MAGIGFFAPLPLAMMMPFMAGQSMMMGDAFGKSYQYGKRKISAMSNEDFNKLTTRDLANDIQADFNAIIPPLSEAVRQSSQFQSLIIQEMGKIIKSLPSEITQFFGVEGGSDLDAWLKVFIAKFLGIPAIGAPQGNLGSGAGFIGAPQTNPFFPGNILNPNEPIDVPPGVSPPDSNFIGPIVPPGGIKPPKPVFKDTRQADWDKQWDSYHKAALTKLAIRDNTFTASFQPTIKKRRNQSSNQHLSGLIQGRNQLLNTALFHLSRVKASIASSVVWKRHKLLYDQKIAQYGTHSILVIQHIKTFIL